MPVDLSTYSAAITAAIRALDCSGNAHHAATLRQASPEVLRYARIGMAGHDNRDHEPTPIAYTHG